MKKVFFFIGVMFVTLLTSCVSVQPAAYLAKEDNEIDSSLRQEINALNTQILGVIQKADFDAFFGYFATGLTDEAKLKQQLQDALPSMTKYISGKTFTTYREYYVKWQGSGSMPAIILPRDDKDYRVSVNRAGDEMYLFFGTNKDFSQSLLSMIYVKQSGNWRLVNSNIGSFKVADKNAMQWYQESTAEYDKGYLIPALFRIQLASNCLRPSPFTKYDSESKITDYAKKLQDEAKTKYTFPIKLSNVKSNPVMYYIEPQFVQNDMIPLVRYVTSYPLDNENALKEEANQMSPVVQEMFVGIADGVSNIVFKAFSEPPTDPNKTYKSYGTVVEIK